MSNLEKDISLERQCQAAGVADNKIKWDAKTNFRLNRGAEDGIG